MAGYNGNWWKTQNEEQRAEFVAGMLDSLATIRIRRSLGKGAGLY